MSTLFQQITETTNVTVTETDTNALRDKLVEEFSKISDELVANINMTKSFGFIPYSHGHAVCHDLATLPTGVRSLGSDPVIALRFRRLENVNTVNFNLTELTAFGDLYDSVLTVLRTKQILFTNGEQADLSNYVSIFDFERFGELYRDSFNLLDDYNAPDSDFNGRLALIRNILHALNETTVRIASYYNGVSALHWLEFQRRIIPLLDKYTIENIVKMFSVIVARCISRTFGKYIELSDAMQMLILSVNNSPEDFLVTDNELSTLESMMRNALTEKYPEILSDTEDYSELQRSIRAAINSEFNAPISAILSAGKIATITAANVRDAVNAYKSESNSIVSGVKHISNTIVELTFKHKIFPKKLHLGGKYYLLTDYAVSKLRSNMGFNVLTIDFGTLNVNYPRCIILNCSHPNVSDTGVVCLGTIRNTDNSLNTIAKLPFPPLSELISMMEMINFSSPHRWRSDHRPIFKSDFRPSEPSLLDWPKEYISLFNPSIDAYLDELLDGVD